MFQLITWYCAKNRRSFQHRCATKHAEWALKPNFSWHLHPSNCLLDTVTVAGIYDLRRLQIKRCGRLGPRAVLALDCCPSLLLFPMWPHFLHRLRNLTQYFMHALQLVRSYLSSWIIQVSKNKMCRSTESAVRFFSCFNEQLSPKSSKIDKSNDRCASFCSICCTAVRAT